mgnify:CR=1 FL=1|tara:strand:- start:163 stop:342 length:180 start_codon:yes stop_codon:yes gene_type:complete
MFTTKELKILAYAMENYTQRLGVISGKDTLDLLEKVSEAYIDSIPASEWQMRNMIGCNN